MNLTIFPRMLVSHDAGWTWLMRVHPRVTRMFFLYVVPFSLLPPAMLLHAADTYGGRMMFGNIAPEEAWWLAVLLLTAELLMVPLMAWAIQRIGQAIAQMPEFHDAFAFAAIAPTPLWLASLALFVPSLTINGLTMAAALLLSAMMIYEGSYRVFRLEDGRQSLLLAGSILAAGLLAWSFLMGLVLFGWNWLVAL